MNTLGITGSNGYIGKNLVKRCSKHNINFNTLSKKKNIKQNNFLFKEIDLLPENFFKDSDIIVHLAGIAHNENISNLDYFRKINVNFAINIGQLCIKHKIKKLIFISSIKALYQENYYGKTKFEAELELTKLFKNCQHTELVIIRPGLIYGNSPKGNLKLIKIFLKFRFIPILSNKNNKISMMHVDDLVDLIIFVSNKKINKSLIEAYDGFVYSTHDIFENLYKEIHKKNFLFKININFLKNTPFLRNKIKKFFDDSKFDTDHLNQIGFKCKNNLIKYD